MRQIYSGDVALTMIVVLISFFNPVIVRASLPVLVERNNVLVLGEEKGRYFIEDTTYICAEVLIKAESNNGVVVIFPDFDIFRGIKAKERDYPLLHFILNFDEFIINEDYKSPIINVNLFKYIKPDESFRIELLYPDWISLKSIISNFRFYGYDRNNEEPESIDYEYKGDMIVIKI